MSLLLAPLRLRTRKAAPRKSASRPPASGISADGIRHAALNLTRWTLLAAPSVCFFILWALNPTVGRFLLFGIPLATLLVVSRSRTDAISWGIYIVGFAVFVDLRTISAELFIPARYEYVIDLERMLFFGAIPAINLQQWFYRLGSPSWLDYSTIAVHISFFLLPHVIALWLWTRDAVLFRRYVVALVACCWVGLVAAFLIPTAPPWLAAETGQIPHVYRILSDVLHGMTPETYDAGYRAVGVNDVAAMPSLHTALACLAGIGAASAGGIWVAVGTAYAVAMMFSLVYLGEHYVVDLLAGCVVALGCWALAKTRRVSRASKSVRPA